jgi:hypothetical protein
VELDNNYILKSTFTQEHNIRNSQKKKGAKIGLIEKKIKKKQIADFYLKKEEFLINLQQYWEHYGNSMGICNQTA